MYLSEMNQTDKKRNFINAFGGYNHQLRIGDSEFFDMKNMTADNYPVLSSRGARNYKLQIASQEYEPIDTSVECGFVEESLSRKYAWYRMEFEISAGEEYVLPYQVNKEYVGTYRVKISFLNDSEEVPYENGFEKVFIAPEGYSKARVNITAERKSGVTGWNEDNTELFITELYALRHNERIRGMLLKGDKLAYMIGSTLYWNGEKFDFSEYTSGDKEQQLISYGAYILIFPAGVYLNTNDTSDYGYLGALYETAGNKVTYSMCDLNGAEYEYVLAAEAPQDPADGQYWMKESLEGDSLYRWSETMAMWTAVTTTYIKISVAGDKGLCDSFELYDTVFAENAVAEELNTSHTIWAKGTTESEETVGSYIVITGILSKVMEQETSVRFARKIPDLDYVCVSNNRVWGCHYGITAEGMVNEIYCCKQGDAKNWYSYMGTSQDSYAISMGDDGEFTGACTYQGYPLFFKENNIYKIYGTYPAAYQLVTYDCRGVQKGSSKGIAIVDEYLVYKSKNDICVFDGNYPVSLSEKLGNRLFSEAAAGSCMSKYYVSMKENDTGEYAVYVYDFKKNLWMKDDDIHIEEFVSSKSGELYGRTQMGIIGFGNKNSNLGLKEVDGTKELVEWYVETGDIGLDMPEGKYISRLKIRASISHGAQMGVSVCYDDTNVWEERWLGGGKATGDGKIKSYEFPIIPRKCDTMKIKISGNGKVDIYSLKKVIEGAGK